ncbi:phosphate acyltransferase PlsX [Algimonas porphyrae]|uniref:Phosphate acyltransferase n=1 Tax=Algimonas porphyrae TaxID=1128113 RepID=A0ABQ5UV50_9PROT|nr:phosphate acyltransferase PlsX [Algimonas porphyrae]GLQ19128.1 phosphate acyltransferase [Algimonas porphyrae]
MLDGLVISIDAMGGDDAPDMVIRGLEYFLTHEGQGRRARFLLHGDQAQLQPLLAKNPRTRERSEVVHTDKVVSMDDKPSQALRRGKDSSMWNAVAAVKAKRAEIAVSAGNTGALMAMSKLQLRMKQGVQRPALAAAWPKQNGVSVVLDVGANIDVDPAQLTEFAVMGEAYYKAIYKKEQPSIGLLNVGTEDQKGHAILKAAHERLSESQLGLNYIGYVEGNDISMGSADVIVTDGFTGNIALKTAEGTAKLIGTFFNEALQGNLWSKITTWLNAFALFKLKRRIDPRRVNGAVFLGLNGIVIKSHGGTDRIGFANAVNIAIGLAETDFMHAIDERLDALHDEDDNIGFIP